MNKPINHICKYFFILIGIFLSSCMIGQEAYFLENLKDEYVFDDHLRIAEDTNCQFVIQDILKEARIYEFRSFDNSEELSRTSCYWVRFRLNTASGFNHYFKNWKLFIGEADYASVFITDSLNNVLVQKDFGRWHPKSKKEEDLNYKTQRVNISFDLSQELTFYVRYHRMDNHKHRIKVKLSKYDINQSSNFLLSTWQDWLFIGFIVTMILLNFLFYYDTRYVAYSYHGLFILGLFIFILDPYNVTLNLPIVSEYPFLVQFIDIVGVGLADLAYFQFIRYYLNLKDKLPEWDKLLAGIVRIKFIFYPLLTLFYFATYNEPQTDRILIIFLLIEYAMIVYFQVFKLIPKDKAARYLIIGSLFLFWLLLVNTLSLFSNIGVSKTLTQLGLMGEVIAFTFGLSYRFRQLKEEEEKAEKIKELSEFKSKLLTDITHEFRTPLTVIQGVTEILMDSSNSMLNPKDLRNKYDAIDRNSKNMLNLINQMLDLAKLESKNLKLDQSMTDLISTVRESIRSLETLAKNKNVLLSFTSSIESLEMSLDVKKLHTIVFNLVSNAIKYTPEYGNVKVSIYTQKGDQNSMATIQISDTGIGISQEDQAHIFDRYYQSQSAQNQSTGTGIGLALVKELVELMNGTIRMESQLGSGTYFTVDLPYKTSKASEDISIDNESSDFLESKPLLLIIDDNQDIIDYLKQLLKQQYKIMVAMDGQEGYDIALSKIPDLIISDLMMPKIDGIRLCEMIKSDKKTNHIPVILLTGKSSYESKLQGLKMGADAYLTKPFRKEELLIRLEKLNEQRQMLRQKFQQFALLDDPKALKMQNSFLYALNAVIEENLDNYKFNVEEMASKMAMSRMQLHRKLKAVSERSSSNYLRAYRLHKSKQKLGDLGLTISEIAWSVGFQDVNYYSKSFQKEFNMTPSEFRKKIKG